MIVADFCVWLRENGTIEIPFAYGYTAEYLGGYNDLVYLRARMYAPGMGRFLTRDTWSGDANNPMSYNIWLYGYANPVTYTDPTGLYSISELYGLEFLGSWTNEDRQATEIAVGAVGYRLLSTIYPQYSEYGSMVEEAHIFKKVYGIDDNDLMKFKWGGDDCYYCRPLECQTANVWTNQDPATCDCEKTNTCDCQPTGGFTHTERLIEFASMWDAYSGVGGASIQNLRKVNDAIHELGHAFSTRLGHTPRTAVKDYSTTINGEKWAMNSRIPDKYGFYEDANASGTRTWVQSGVVDGYGSEVFADMFLGWVYDKWENSPFGTERKRFMDENMPGWIRRAMALP